MQFGIDFAQLGVDVGSGAVIGAIIGFAAKKVAKLVALLVGLQLALFKFLESQQILTVDWERLSAGLIDVASTPAEPPSVVVSLLSALPVSGGFVVGFFLGFRKG